MHYPVQEDGPTKATCREHFIDGWSYFASLEKLAGHHSIALTAFGAPTKAGRSAAVVQEIMNLAGTHYYNPNWGYQNGKKRNAVVGIIIFLL